MAIKVLITDRFEGEALSWLKSHGDFTLTKSRELTPSADELKDCAGLICRSGTAIDSALLKNAPDLKVVVTATSGFDHIDLAACQDAGVQAFHCPEGHAQSAAELTWALVLACARKISMAHQKAVAADWNRHSLVGAELGGKTYGIVGFGRIGRRVARIAQAFGMRVQAYDPYIEPEIFRSHGVEWVGYQELLQVADVVSLHVPKTAETFHMVERNALECLHPHTILINTSRGGVILEQHLVEALNHGTPGAVGLDVFEKEPLEADSPLFRFSNVVITPHIGANTHEGFARVSRHAAESLVGFFAGTPTGCALPPKDLWFTNPKGFN